MKFLVQTKMKIEKIWFEGEWLYGLGDDGKTYRQSLLWYKRLMKAGEVQRSRYEFSTVGIHWPEIDEDVSFESFAYPEAEPTKLQRFLLTHPELNIAGFAQRFGLNASLLRSYANGFKTPSPEKEREILGYIQELGIEYESVA